MYLPMALCEWTGTPRYLVSHQHIVELERGGGGGEKALLPEYALFRCKLNPDVNARHVDSTFITPDKDTSQPTVAADVSQDSGAG